MRIFWSVAMTTQMEDDPCYSLCFFRFHALLRERESGGVAIANLYIHYRTLIIASQWNQTLRTARQRDHIDQPIDS
jgi:hypothetical protein